MIFKSISIKEGMFERTIDLDATVNLIHSHENSKGKTTLLRFLLYSLGYNIPSTRKIKFEQCEVKTVIETETSGLITLFRGSNSYIVASIGDEESTFVLPDQQNSLHELLYGTDNPDILNNVLGAFYVDQEKGWTLLNRGIVIGSIHFNIEELIRGLSSRDCSVLLQEEARISRELGKYKQLFSVAKYQESISNRSESLISETFNETVDIELEQLQLRQAALKKELNRIDGTLSDNRRFKRFVAEMKILVQLPDGTTIPVSEDNIVGLSDTIDFLIAKRKIVSSELATLSNKIDRLHNSKNTENEQTAFWETETIAETFDRRLASVPINAIIIEKEIKRLEEFLKSIRKTISENTKINNDVVDSLYKNVLKYAIELSIGDDESLASSYLFTSNLKELSGALLHKTVFAFRLAYIIEIEKVLNIKLPIILDSPSGKEVDRANIQLMVDILKRDFSDHQIIIASIFEYDFDTINVIEIKNQLIEAVE